jgi:PGF-CTERM protein
MKRKTNSICAFAAMSALMLSFPTAMAVGPADLVAAPIQEKVNSLGQDLQQKAVQYVQEGNFSASHLNQELNETKNDLMQEASKQLNQSLPLDAQDLQERAKEELESRAAQTPGFELAVAFVGLLCVAILARRIP